MKTNEIQREGRKKDRLERELRQAKTDLDSKAAEIKNLQQSVEQSSANVAKLNGEIKEQKVSEIFCSNICVSVKITTLTLLVRKYICVPIFNQ